jgi:hypothetical protein
LRSWWHYHDNILPARVLEYSRVRTGELAGLVIVAGKNDAFEKDGRSAELSEGPTQRRMAVSFDGCRKSDFEHDGRGCRSEGELDFELAALHVVAQFQARHDQL